MYDNMSREDLIKLLEDNEVYSGKYGLKWDNEKEPEKIVLECDRNIPILDEIKDKEIVNDGADNILIEGDNFHSLSVLNYTHEESVDVIYIDPPYNTGSKDFIYNDKFVDEEDGYRHSKWLSFMSKRLKIAKNVLKKDGVIFISIDDNEQAQLKLLCDTIFGEKNFIDTIMVEMSITSGMKVGAAKDGTITKNGEFIHVYAKNPEWKNVKRKPLYDFVSGYDTHFTKFMNDDGSLCDLTDVLSINREIIDEFKKFGIALKNNKVNVKSLAELFDKSNVLHDFIVENVHKIVQPRTETPILPDDLTLSPNRWTKYVSEKRSDPYYLSCDTDGNIIRLIPMSVHYHMTDDINPKYGRTVIRGDYWKNYWKDMVNVYKEGDMPFKNGKKPVRLIKQLLKWAVGYNKDAVILDFFAGSGTTGHAVLELNKEDNGNRRFILCTNNENDICEKVTYVRLKNVIEGYNNKKGLGGNLKYYKTEFVLNTNNRDQLYFDLTEKCIPMLCIKENNFIEYKSLEGYKIFTNLNKDNYTCIYYDLFGENEKEFIKELELIKEHKKIYKFSLDDTIQTDGYEHLINYKMENIPDKIIKVYKQLIKMSKED